MTGELSRFKAAVNELLTEVKKAISEVEPSRVEALLDALVLTKARDKKVLVVGAGRSGLVGRGFAMRLMHLGFDVYVLGETITPAVGRGDLVLVISGSGTTTIPVTSAEIAKRVGAKVLAITSHPESPLARLADLTIPIPGREKAAREDEYYSRQLLGEHEPLAPLGTFFEASCMIFLDGIIAELMGQLETSEADMKAKHAVIE
ncbi:MAG: 6-phospho-3-hexuloisomerase [Candidatus Bathyarchaeia archaeon]